MGHAAAAIIALAPFMIYIVVPIPRANVWRKLSVISTDRRLSKGQGTGSTMAFLKFVILCNSQSAINVGD